MASCKELSQTEKGIINSSDTNEMLGLTMSLSGQATSSSHIEYGVAVCIPTPDLHYDQVHCGDSSSDSPTEVSLPKASDRESRIRAEKQRRSQYNLLIGELMSLLPAITQSQRKIDKTSVLRIAANELRNVHVFGNNIKCSHMENWSKMLHFLELLGGILISITCKGRIFNVSPNVEEQLGHSQLELLGQSIYDYVHPDDVDIVHKHIYPPALHSGHEDSSLYTEHHDFAVRILRAGARSDPPSYEYCRIDGSLRKSDKATSNGVQDEQIIRRQRVRHNRTFSSSGNDFTFIGMIRVEAKARPTCMLHPTAHLEYWTRHLIDGRIVQVDQSISLVAGYMTEEVTGTSAFHFMHKEDIRWVMCVLRQMYDQNKEFGESYYRLMARTGDFIYMRTRGFLEIDSKSKDVQSFVCINSVISDDFGKHMLEEMKHKYSVLVNVTEQQLDTCVSLGGSPVEHPQRLKRIVMHLVEKPTTSDCNVTDCLKIIPPSRGNIISAIKNSERVVSETGIKFDSRKRKGVDVKYNISNESIKRHNLI